MLRSIETFWRGSGLWGLALVVAPNKSANECPVCLAPLEALKLPCGLYFHVGCIEPWLKTADSCPTCRSKVKSSKT